MTSTEIAEMLKAIRANENANKEMVLAGERCKLKLLSREWTNEEITAIVEEELFLVVEQIFNKYCK